MVGFMWIIVSKKPITYCLYVYVSLNKFFFKFIFERENESASGGRAEREGEIQRQNLEQALGTVSAEPDVRLELTSHEIMT